MIEKSGFKVVIASQMPLPPKSLHTIQQGSLNDPTLLIRGLIGVVLLIVVSIGSARAHPAHAEPVDYPFVVGFERFYSSLDDDDYLAEGGLLLINELNCVACHAPPEALQEQLKGFVATDLAGTGSRLSHIDLEMMIRNPRFVKRDTIMPSMFAGPDRDLADVEALKHFLASLRDPESEKALTEKGDVDSGRRLYHRIGCVACHAPEKDYRPEDLPDFVELELTGLPSIPMNLADKYDETALARFLLDPLKHRPSGRMPEFKLTEKEAVDLAAYLKAGEGVELPEVLTQALEAEGEFTVDEAKITAGREVFLSKNCVSCHGSEVTGTKAKRVMSKPLVELQTEEKAGCLSDRPVGGLVPAYFLDEVQKRAIVGAIAKLKAGREPLDDYAKIDWSMSTLNCYACHERDGKGGPETAREPYFAVSDVKAYDMGRSGNIPPALKHIGRKLNDDWLDKVLAGKSEKLRTTMMARMPVFEKAHTKSLKELFQKVDLPEETIKLSGDGNLDRGKELFHSEAIGCATCHGESGPSIPLDRSAERLRPSFFKELLMDPWGALPGSPMPETMKDRPNRDSEINDLWKFLKDMEN